MRSSYSLSLSDSDEEQEQDTCQVYWETKSILEQHPNPVLPPKPRPPPPPSTTSTPLKPKRSTTAAALPSPSTSTTSTKRPLRQPKRTRNSAPETSSQRVDASTLKLVSQLAARFSQRSSNGSTPLRERSGNTATAVGRTRASNEAGGSAKGKAKALPTPTTIRAIPSTTSALPAPKILQLSSSKASLTTSTGTSPTLALSKSPLRPTTTAPLTRSRISAPAPASAPVPAVRAPEEDEEEEDFDSYFDQVDDESLEMALSQMEQAAGSSQGAGVALPCGGTSAAPAAPAPAAQRVVPAPVAALATKNVARVQPSPIRSSPRLSKVASTTAPARTAVPPPPALQRPIARPSLLVRGSSSVSVSSASTSKDRREAVEELARREMELLACEGLGGGWSDEDF